MTDDIVTRLRGQRTNSVLCAEAADEIERLRADRDKWKHRAEEYFYTDPDCECPMCDEMRTALNGNR